MHSEAHFVKKYGWQGTLATYDTLEKIENDNTNEKYAHNFCKLHRLLAIFWLAILAKRREIFETEPIWGWRQHSR